jgi:integrase
MAIHEYKGKKVTSYRVYWRNPITHKIEYERFYDKEKAKRYDAEIKYRLKKDPESFAPPKQTSEVTFEELAVEYLEKHPTMTPNNKKSTTYMLQSEILPYIGHVQAELVGKDEYTRLVDKWQEKGNKPSSITRKMTIVRSILNWAKERGKIEYVTPYSLNHRKVNVYDHSVDAPTPEELQALYDQAAPHLQRFIVLGMYTGARPGPSELLSIRWEDVDWKNKTIYVNSAAKGGVQARKVHISKNLLSYLQKWHRQDRQKIEYIVHYNGKKLKSIHAAWYSSKEKAEITRPLNPYSLRHYFATQALANGADIRSVASILGNTPAIVLRTYIHATDKYLKKAVETIPDLNT